MFGVGLREAVEAVRNASSSFDARLLTGSDAAAAVELCSEAERMLAACRLAAIRRVEETNAFKSSGHVDVASWAAGVTGVGKADAAGEIATARRLESLPQTAEALKSGEISQSQAAQIARVADVESESALLDVASHQPVAVLRAECRKVESARSAAEERRRHEARRAHRLCNLRVLADGNMSLYAIVLPEEGARLQAQFDRERKLVVRAARKCGREDSWNQYSADAFMSLIDRSGTTTANGKPSTTVHVVVDHSALMRGYREKGETAEVVGVGQVPIEHIRSLMGDAYLSTVIMKGEDVIAATSATKFVPTVVREALRLRDKYCGVPSCEETKDLEIHHIWESSKGGPSQVDNLVRVCKWHHRMITNQGWQILGRPGEWRFEYCPEGLPPEHRQRIEAKSPPQLAATGTDNSGPAPPPPKLFDG